MINRISVINIPNITDLSFTIDNKLEVYVGENVNLDYKINFLAVKSYESLGDSTRGHFKRKQRRQSRLQTAMKGAVKWEQKNIQRRKRFYGNSLPYSSFFITMQIKSVHVINSSDSTDKMRAEASNRRACP